MNCPHCQKETPAKYSSAWCPFCGRDFSPDRAPSPDTSRINWPVFFAILFAPAIITLLGVLVNAFAIVPPATFGGSFLAGIACGGMVANQLARGMEPNRFLVIVLSTIFIAVSFILCFAGCMIPAILPSKGR